jgi:hypothetical protein
MAELILTDEQAKVVARAEGPVTVRDATGKYLGQMEPELTPAKIAELKRQAASPGPWYTSEQVHARLLALQQEWDRTGGFDQVYAREFLARLNEADPGQMMPREPAE